MRPYLMMLCICFGMSFLLSANPGYCQTNTAQPELFSRENLLAWCIVPYDKMERSPDERAAMLQQLGISRFAYDWRAEHLPLFEQELKALQQHGISLQAVWLWVGANSGGLLDEQNTSMLELLEKHGQHTELWVSFDPAFFAGLADTEKLYKAVSAIRQLQQRAQKMGCRVGLYNHGDWFGDPRNQIKIIKELGADNVGIVYNFHHAHHQIDIFPDLLQQMKPYLYAVNINGMDKNGPKILTVGEGSAERTMLQALKNAGYSGPVGIIGHLENEDAAEVLKRNMAGLQSLTKDM